MTSALGVLACCALCWAIERRRRERKIRTRHGFQPTSTRYLGSRHG